MKCRRSRWGTSVSVLVVSPRLPATSRSIGTRAVRHPALGLRFAVDVPRLRSSRAGTVRHLREFGGEARAVVSECTTAPFAPARACLEAGGTGHRIKLFRVRGPQTIRAKTKTVSVDRHALWANHLSDRRHGRRAADATRATPRSRQSDAEPGDADSVPKCPVVAGELGQCPDDRVEIAPVSEECVVPGGVDAARAISRGGDVREVSCGRCRSARRRDRGRRGLGSPIGSPVVRAGCRRARRPSSRLRSDRVAGRRTTPRRPRRTPRSPDRSSRA